MRSAEALDRWVLPQVRHLNRFQEASTVTTTPQHTHVLNAQDVLQVGQRTTWACPGTSNVALQAEQVKSTIGGDRSVPGPLRTTPAAGHPLRTAHTRPARLLDQAGAQGTVAAMDAPPPPGWYPSPEGLRWWDGAAWGPLAPTNPPAPDAPTPHPGARPIPAPRPQAQISSTAAWVSLVVGLTLCVGALFVLMLPVEARNAACGSSLTRTQLEQSDMPGYEAGLSPVVEDVVQKCNATKSTRRAGAAGAVVVGGFLLVGGALSRTGRSASEVLRTPIRL
jgi:hypothetical protein